MNKTFYERNFKLWHYNISHGEMLIRSPKSDSNSTNIDIMFFDVQYIELPRFLPKLEIVDTKNEDILYVKGKVDKLLDEKNITIFSSNNHQYLVVASVMKIVENELDIFELPFAK